MESAIPLAFTASWASGINPYLLVLLMGLIGRFTDWAVPAGLERTDVLIVFAVLAVIDTVADKVMLVDSVWDAINTAIRPIAGAVVAVLIASPSVDLPTAVIAAAGGTVALITHLAKATTRIAVNTSPEPASNVAVSRRGGRRGGRDRRRRGRQPLGGGDDRARPAHRGRGGRPRAPEVRAPWPEEDRRPCARPRDTQGARVGNTARFGTVAASVLVIPGRGGAMSAVHMEGVFVEAAFAEDYAGPSTTSSVTSSDRGSRSPTG